MRVGRVPLADLGSMRGPGRLTPKNPKNREHNTTKSDGAGQVTMENDPTPHSDPSSDDEPFGKGDLLTSTDQEQLSALRSKLPRHNYDETTTEF